MGGSTTQGVPVQKVAQKRQQGASGGIIIWGQGREGQGRPADANGRH